MNGLAMAELPDMPPEQKAVESFFAVTVQPKDFDWHVLITPPRKERFVQRQMERQGYSILLPMQVRWRFVSRYAEKKAPVEFPMMPRYLFLATERGSEIAWLPIIDLETVAGPVRLGVIGMNGRPSRLDPGCVVPLLRYHRERFTPPSKRKAATFKSGDSVEIEGGPFDAMVGTIEDILTAKSRALLVFEGIPGNVDVPLEILKLRE